MPVTATRSASRTSSPGGQLPTSAPAQTKGTWPWDPFSRWPRRSDAALAVVLLVASVSLKEGPGDSLLYRPVTDLPLPALLLFVTASAALYWRRRAPLLVLSVALLAWTMLLGSDFSHLGGHTILSLYAVGRYGVGDRWGHVAVAGSIAVLTLDGVTAPTPWGETGFGAFVMFAAWYAGRRLQLRSEGAERAVLEREAEHRRIVNEERTRIARELHDVVAHRVSLMTVQAGAAKTVALADPEGAQRAMGAVEVAGRQALDELRHLLGVLRPDARGTGTGPQPGLADLHSLVAQTRAAGLDVGFTCDELPAGLPARLELSAYRIVQESLTNVMKHAGPGARAEVRVTCDRGCVVIDVTDDGHGSTVLPGSSHGIVGMRERALLLGGSLIVGPRPAGGFQVQARLPVIGVQA